MHLTRTHLQRPKKPAATPDAQAESSLALFTAVTTTARHGCSVSQEHYDSECLGQLLHLPALPPSALGLQLPSLQPVASIFCLKTMTGGPCEPPPGAWPPHMQGHLSFTPGMPHCEGPQALHWARLASTHCRLRRLAATPSSCAPISLRPPNRSPMPPRMSVMGLPPDSWGAGLTSVVCVVWLPLTEVPPVAVGLQLLPAQPAMTIGPAGNLAGSCLKWQ